MKTKHCKKCHRVLRNFNQSGFCSNCNKNKEEIKYTKLHYERLKRLRELRCQLKNTKK